MNTTYKQAPRQNMYGTSLLFCFQCLNRHYSVRAGDISFYSIPLADSRVVLHVSRIFIFRRYREMSQYTRIDGRVVRGQQPSVRTAVCSVLQEGTGGELPEPYKMTSDGPLICRFLSKLTGTDFREARIRAWCPQMGWLCEVKCDAARLGITNYQLNGTIATSAPFSSQIRAGSVNTCERCELFFFSF